MVFPGQKQVMFEIDVLPYQVRGFPEGIAYYMTEFFQLVKMIIIKSTCT